MSPPKTDPQKLHPLSARALALYGAAALAVIALLVWLVSVLDPLPPSTITLASGPDGSSYEVFAKRYQKLLEKQGVKVRVIETAGGMANLALLNKADSGVDLGFVQGGLAPDDDDTKLVSLGTLCYEPLWFFTRELSADAGLPALRGKRVAVGAEGSDERALLTKLLKRHGMDAGSFQMLTLSPEASQDALLGGQIDAAVMVNSWASPVVRKLAAADGIQVASFSRADAYVALFPALTKRILPAGAASLQKDRPSHDISLLATKTSLIARASLHPGLQYLLLEALSKVHARPGIFQKGGEFPTAEEMDIPLSSEARHYYKSGQPFLQRYLPFWLAALAEQWVVVLIPLLGLTYPLVRGLMFLYAWAMQRRIFTLYGELHWMESQIDKLDGGSVPEELKARMRRLEERARKVRVSAKYMPMLYTLRENAGQVRSRLEK